MIESLSGSVVVPEKKGEQLLDKELQEIWRRVLINHPELSNVEIIIPENSQLAYTGGEFLLPDDDNLNPAIVVLPASDSIYERLKTERPLAIKIAADLLGRQVEEMSGEDIKKFIFLHEIGHVYDFLKNFESDPQIGKDYAIDAWNMLREEQLASLPVPGLDPNDLAVALEGAKDLSEFVKNNSGLEVRLGELKINTIKELLFAQEMGYRNTPKESFADRFAANFLRKYDTME